MTNARPTPEQLLARINEEEQGHLGKLKIYLGAAPGVGKTYEMLHAAIDKRNQGLDVLIGIIESHGRQDTENLLKNLDVLPRQKIRYKGRDCYEFDLDAAIKRHPGLILIDEMAHTNCSGLRHAKRWQDIKELLERGIDVYTTLNVQHIESLNNDVAQIIHAPIHETVPDSMIERADTIVLIDIAPEDLLVRLKEGKIYIPKQAEIAQEHFFRKGNLYALRELALRITAEKVNSDVLWYRQGEGIKAIWPVKDKIMVCVGPRTESLRLIRAAKRIASSLKVQWLAVYIDKPGQSSEENRNKAIKNLRLAEQLGAETHVLTGFDYVKEIMHFAREQNVTLIIIWKRILTRWRDWFRRSLVDEIVRNSQEINIYIITGEETNSGQKTKQVSQKTPWYTYVASISIVAITTVLNFILFGRVDSSNLIMVYLLGVTLVALMGRTGPSVVASILSVIVYDYFFIAPFYAIVASDFNVLFTLVTMLVVTQVISHLTILIRKQTESVYLSQHKTTALYTFSKKLSMTRGTEAILALGTQEIARFFRSNVMVLTPKNEMLEVAESRPSGLVLNAKEQSIAQWVFDMRRPAGLGTDTLSSSKALYLPLIGPSQVQGVMRVLPQQLLTPEQRELLDTYINQLALTLEADKLYEKTRSKELQSEKDKVQTALLASVFNDLTHPLQTLISTFNDLEFPQQEESAMSTAIEIEMAKLSRINNNLHQIIYWESEGLLLQKKLSPITPIIYAAIDNVHKAMGFRTVDLQISKDIPNLMLDIQLLEEVFVQLLDNAIKFSNPDSTIVILVERAKNTITCSVKDIGLTILSKEKSQLIKNFYKDKQRIASHGLGIGLTICEKIIQAHGGSIWAENIDGKGTVVRFTLPI